MADTDSVFASEVPPNDLHNKQEVKKKKTHLNPYFSHLRGK